MQSFHAIPHGVRAYHPPGTSTCSTTKKRHWASTSRVFTGVSLHRHDWLNIGDMTEPNLQLPLLPWGQADPKLQPSDHMVGFSGDQPVSWSYLGPACILKLFSHIISIIKIVLSLRRFQGHSMPGTQDNNQFFLLYHTCLAGSGAFE